MNGPDTDNIEWIGQKRHDHVTSETKALIDRMCKETGMSDIVVMGCIYSGCFSYGLDKGLANGGEVADHIHKLSGNSQRLLDKKLKAADMDRGERKL